MTLEERMASIVWFHSIDLGNGVITPGVKPLSVLDAEALRIFDPINMDGATVLDVGAWNGAHSFNAKRRGAGRVLAADHFTWVHEGWKGRAGFDLANDQLEMGVEALQIDVPDITPARTGMWDVTLFLGVLYHLPSPLEGLEKVADTTNACLVVETFTDLNDIERPALAYYPGTTLNNDPSNFFGPNVSFVREALKECGFKSFDAYFGEYQRLILHAWRDTSRRKLGDGPDTVMRHSSLHPVVRSAKSPEDTEALATIMLTSPVQPRSFTEKAIARLRRKYPWR